MTLPDYREALRRSGLLVAATTGLGLAAALGFTMLATPTYQAQSQLFVSAQAGDEISGAYTAGLFVQQRIKSYVTLVDTPDVLQPVIEDLDLHGGPAQLAAQVSAQTPTDTELINVQATDVNAQLSAEIADSTARSLAEQIAKLESTKSGTKLVTAELIRPAELPTAPSTPHVQLNLLLGLLLGLGAGIGIVVMRAKLDTSIRSEEQLMLVSGARVLGTVGFDSGASKDPLALQPGTHRAEAYRTIRTNLRFMDVGNPPASVVVTSSVPLEGKTTTAVNLAIAIAEGGSKVLLVEADLRRPRVAGYLGMQETAGLTELLRGHEDVSSVIKPWRDGLLDFLPAGAIPPNPSELLGSKEFADLLTDLCHRYSVVILNAPPLAPVTDAAILATFADGAILVSRFGSTSRDQVEKSADSVRRTNARLLGTILTFAPQKGRPYFEDGNRADSQAPNGQDYNPDQPVHTLDRAPSPEARRI